MHQKIHFLCMWIFCWKAVTQSVWKMTFNEKISSVWPCEFLSYCARVPRLNCLFTTPINCITVLLDPHWGPGVLHTVSLMYTPRTLNSEYGGWGCLSKGWPSLCTFWWPFPISHKPDTGTRHSKKSWAWSSRSVTLVPHLPQPWQNAREYPMVSAPSPSTASPVGVPLGLHKPFPRADKCFLFTAISISTRWEFKSLKL